MCRHPVTATVAVLLAAALAATAQAASPTETAKSACRAEKHDMGTRLFKTTYAAESTAKAMVACAAKAEPAAEAAAKNAAKACKDERAADADAFAEQYGGNENKHNAYGKCVSQKVQETTDETTGERVTAAQACKSQREDDKAGFEAEWGTKRNAFGKCVSATATA